MAAVSEDTSSEQTRLEAKVFEPGQCVEETGGEGRASSYIDSAI